MEHHNFAGFHVHRRHAQHFTLGITNQIQRLPFDEKLRVDFDVALIHRMQHRMSRAIGGGAGTTHRFFAKVRHMTAKRSLINPSVIQAIKGHAVMLKLDHAFVGVAYHVLNRVLVAQPIRTFDRVIHMPMPMVFL